MTPAPNSGKRANLKKIFSKGVTPTQEDFHLLIDATLNLRDDHLHCLPDGGLKVFANPKEGTFLEFQMDREDASRNWVILRQNDPRGQPGVSIRYNPHRQSNLQNPPDDPLFVAESGKVGICHNKPRHELEVGGTVAMETRLGTYSEGVKPADGYWHDILEQAVANPDHGYYGMEVLAYVVAPQKSGRYGILHAICMGAYPKGNHWLLEQLGFHNRNGIQTTSTYFESKRNSITIRWGGSREAPRLELKTHRRLPDCTVHFRITNLLPEIKLKVRS